MYCLDSNFQARIAISTKNVSSAKIQTKITEATVNSISCTNFQAGNILGPLDGEIFAVKDNFCVRGSPATCASHMLKNFVPTYDATVVEKLR